MLTYVIIDVILVGISAFSIFNSIEKTVVILIEIYLSICTYSLYKKLESESNAPALFNVAVYNTAPIHCQQINASSEYPQVPAYQPPVSFQRDPKFAEANELPSYDSVVPSAPSK